MKVFAITVVVIILGWVFAPRQTIAVLLAWAALLFLYHKYFAI